MGMMRRSIVVILALIWLLVSCQAGSVEWFVQERVVGQNIDPTTFQVHAVQTHPEGTLVLYSGDDSLNPAHQHLGFAIAQRKLTGWELGMTGSIVRDPSILGGETVDLVVNDISYETSMGQNPVFTHQLIYGELISPAAVSILAVFKDTSVAQETPGNHFVFVTSKSNPLCELHILDGQQGVIEIITPSDSWRWSEFGSNLRPNHVQTCSSQ
jgi:hypothetical protein